MANYVFSMANTNLLFGWNETIDLGTTGDILVDASGGGDYTTITAALAAASPGDTIRVRGGTYREQVTMISGVDNANRTEILAYGTERPVITAADVLTGWVACDAGDATRVGANWANMYKRTGLAKTSIASDEPMALNLFENGTRMNLCIGWGGGDLNDKFYQGNNGDWYTSGTPNTSAGKIVSYTDATVTGLYSVAQIENCILGGHADPNVNFFTRVSGVSGSVITPVYQNGTYETNSYKDTYALFNLLPAMEQGQWGWWDNGTTVDVYCWPTDSANLTGNIEYSAREHCIYSFGPENWTIKGLELRQSAAAYIDSSNSRAGANIFIFTTGSKSNVTIEHCKTFGTYILNAGYAALRNSNYTNVKVHNLTIEDCQQCFGMFAFNGDVGDFQNLLVKRVEKSPYRFYGVTDYVVAYCRGEDCGLAAHANKMNFYEQCKDVLVWGAHFVNCSGYLTHQETSDITWAFCVADDTRTTETNSTRTFVDQGNSTAPPTPTGTSYMFNNTWLPGPAAIGGTASNGLAIGKTLANTAVFWDVHNNLYNGDDPTVSGQITAWGGNWNTGPDGAYNGNDTADAQTDVWTDPANGDFTIKAGAAIRSAASQQDLTSIIATLTAQFGDRFTRWDRDASGRIFNKTNPPVGAVNNYDYTGFITTPAQWAPYVL